MAWSRETETVFSQPSATMSHRYYPTTLSLPTFASNEQDLLTNATAFSLMWVALLSTTWFWVGKLCEEMKLGDKLVLLWFVLCGTLHIFFEGYFVLNHETFAGKQDLFAQLWKEYALSDSRYLSGDLFVLCAEAITVVFWGPLSYLTAIAVARSSPWRHPLQLVVSLGHLYGDTLYLASSFVDLYGRNVSYSRPEAYYLWFYFFFMNAIWLVIPGILMYQSITATVEAFVGREKVGEVHQPATPRVIHASGHLEKPNAQN